MKRCGELPMHQGQVAQETGKDRPAKATRSPLPSRPNASLWNTPRTLTGGGESMQRKHELGRTASGGGDLQEQSEQQWQTPATDSFRSRGGATQERNGTRPAGAHPMADPSQSGLPKSQSPALLGSGGGHPRENSSRTSWSTLPSWARRPRRMGGRPRQKSRVGARPLPIRLAL